MSILSIYIYIKAFCIIVYKSIFHKWVIQPVCFYVVESVLDKIVIIRFYNIGMLEFRVFLHYD